ncbi:MAG TPA: hypothetical protein VNL98_04825 [Gemmatimonadales bacterium]|nr:hypothetical protein [Gemmatimonadales bacterium]
MKRLNFLMIIAAVAVMTVAAVQGGSDIANRMDGVVVEAHGIFNGTADTSTAASLAGYTGAAVIVITAGVDNTAGTLANVVLQDSSALASWTARDSIAVDSVNNKYYDLHYRRTAGVGAKLRVITRGGAAADTVNRAVVIVRTCQRVPC